MRLRLTFRDADRLSETKADKERQREKMRERGRERWRKSDTGRRKAEMMIGRE